MVKKLAEKLVDTKNCMLPDYEKQLEEKNYSANSGKSKASKVHFKENMKPLQQKERKIPIHLQKAVSDELGKFKKDGRIADARMQMPNLDHLDDSVSMRLSTDLGEELWVSTIDIENANGQIELDEEMAKNYVVTIVEGETMGHYCCKRGFYGLADMPLVFQGRLDRLLRV